jgi:hypothetical protein
MDLMHSSLSSAPTPVTAAVAAAAAVHAHHHMLQVLGKVVKGYMHVDEKSPVVHIVPVQPYVSGMMAIASKVCQSERASGRASEQRRQSNVWAECV